MKKSKRPVKRTKTKKIKKLVINHDDIVHVEAPEGHVPFALPGPVPHVLRIVPKPLTWMQRWFGK